MAYTSKLFAICILATWIPLALCVGAITCISALIRNADPNNTSLVPIHYAEVYDGTDTFVGPAEPSSCSDLVNIPPDGISDWTGGGTPVRVASARFWITNDGCLNVMLRGIHDWCCPDFIEPGDWSVTTCAWF